MTPPSSNSWRRSGIVVIPTYVLTHTSLLVNQGLCYSYKTITAFVITDITLLGKEESCVL